MNKKSLAKKIFNFKKNKKKITEEWKDEGLGNLQDILSGASLILGGRAKTIAAGLAAAVNMGRIELDKTGTIPSKSGNLETQGQILMGRTLGLATRSRNPQLTTRSRNAQNRNYGRRNSDPLLAGPAPGPYGGDQHHAQNAVLFGALGNRGNPLLALGAVASGQSNNVFDDAVAVLGSSEIARRHVDDLSNSLGIPNIPGLSKQRTEKEPLSNVRKIEVTRAPTALAAISAANAMR